MFLLKIDNLSKSFHVNSEIKKVLVDISLQFTSGAVGLIGENGIGKTTFIKACIGMLHYDGVISYCGIDLQKMNRHEKSKMYSFLLCGAQSIYSRLTPKENLQYLSSIKGVQFSTIKQKYEYYSKKMNIDNIQNELVEGLSSGMRQKVAISCCLSMDTPVYFLDEPTIGLDRESILGLVDIIKELTELNKLIIISSHDYYFVEQITSNYYFFSKEGSIKQHLTSQVLDSLYLFKVSHFCDELLYEFSYSDLLVKENIVEFVISLNRTEFYFFIEKTRNIGVNIISIENLANNINYKSKLCK